MKSPSPPVSHIGFVSAPQIPAGGFTFRSATVNFPAVVGDFNGDGNQDAAEVVETLASGGDYIIAVALGNGDGTFQAPVLTDTGRPAANPMADPIWVADLNGDGNDDIVMGHQFIAGGAPASFEVWLSNGDGTFTSQGDVLLTPPNDTHITWGTLYDVNTDGNFDVVIADGVKGVIWTATGNGDGTFNAPTSTPIPAPAISADGAVAFADFNKDGVLDFAAPSSATNQVNVYLGINTGGYNAGVPLNTPDNAYATCFDVAGDLNGDTYPEIVSGNGVCATSVVLPNTVTVYVNNGDGTFQTGVYYPVGVAPDAVTIANLRGPGNLNNDVIAVDAQSADARVLLGNGDGTLQPATPGYAIGGGPHTQALVGDFNNDGNTDLIVGDSQFSFVYFQGYGDGTFRSAINYYAKPTGNGFQPKGIDIASGDFNGDGIPDFVIGNANSTVALKANGVTVFLSNPDGSMQTGVPYSTGPATFELQHVAVADFDGDGKLDIAAADSVNGVVQIFTGKGDGTFSAGATYATGTSASALGLVVGDFNGDGKPDLAVVNNYGSPAATADVAILLNNGQGGFTLQSPNLTLSNVGRKITAADLNGDGKLDLVVPLYGTSTTAGTNVAVLLGNGDGTFKAESDVAVGNNPFYAAVGDLNGDGKADLAVTIEDQTNSLKQGIAIALGNGDGTFGAATLLPSSLQNPAVEGPSPAYVKMVDLDLDGHLDLVYSNFAFGTVGVLYGKGNGTFYDPVEFAAGHQAFGIALADANADGQVDVVATGNSPAFSGVTVLLNKGGTTTLQSSAPHTPPGVSVTFTATVHGAKLRGVLTIPTGTVTFNDGTKVLGSGPLDSSGKASFATSTLAVGTHSITAQYGGDTNYVSSTSAVLNEVVGQAGSSTGTPTSSANPSTPGQSVTLAAIVTSTVSGDTLVPTGKVTFNDGTTALGFGTLDSSGKASFPTTSLAVGKHSITAQYGGDGNFTASTSAAALNQVVVQPDYSLAASPTSQKVNPGSSASYTITLTPSNGYDGTVTINCPSTLPSGVSCNTPLTIASGQATLTIKTTGPSAALIAVPDVNPHPGGSNLWASLTGVGMLGIVLAGDWKKRNRRRMGILLLILALAMILALVGCSGGGSSSSGGGGGGGGGTPAGSYPIQVTATGTAGTNGGNTAPHPLNLTLVVN